MPLCAGRLLLLLLSLLARCVRRCRRLALTLLSGPVRRCRLRRLSLLSRTVWRTRLGWLAWLACAIRRRRLLRRARGLRTWLLRAWPLLQIVLPLRRGLSRLVAARAGPVRIGLPQGALLGYDLASDNLRRVHLTHDALVARGLLRRDHERGCGRAAAGAGPDRKAA